MLDSVKQNLLEKISNTNDENLLLLLQADFDYFSEDKSADVLDELSEEDKADLAQLVNEPFGKDTLSQNQFVQVLQQWRTQ